MNTFTTTSIITGALKFAALNDCNERGSSLANLANLSLLDILQALTFRKHIRPGIFVREQQGLKTSAEAQACLRDWRLSLWLLRRCGVSGYLIDKAARAHRDPSGRTGSQFRMLG